MIVVDPPNIQWRCRLVLESPDGKFVFRHDDAGKTVRFVNNLFGDGANYAIVFEDEKPIIST